MPRRTLRPALAALLRGGVDIAAGLTVAAIGAVLNRSAPGCARDDTRPNGAASLLK
jgi:hypothetical protein